MSLRRFTLYFFALALSSVLLFPSAPLRVPGNVGVDSISAPPPLAGPIARSYYSPAKRTAAQRKIALRFALLASR